MEELQKEIPESEIDPQIKTSTLLLVVEIMALTIMLPIIVLIFIYKVLPYIM